MSLFVIIGHDVANSTAQRKITRSEHLERVTKLDEQGKIIIAGPTPINSNDPEKGMSGSVIIAEFDSLEEAQTWCDEEPYLRDGVYSHIEIKPFVQVLPVLGN